VLAQVEQVSASAASLMDMAQGLQRVVAQFTLSSNGNGKSAKAFSGLLSK
jgi:hypothetical protein